LCFIECVKKISIAPPASQQGFDLFRLNRSKKEVDVSPPTLRKWFKEGLPFYKMEKAVFVSRSQLQAFILARANQTAAAA